MIVPILGYYEKMNKTTEMPLSPSLWNAGPVSEKNSDSNFDRHPFFNKIVSFEEHFGNHFLPLYRRRMPFNDEFNYYLEKADRIEMDGRQLRYDRCLFLYAKKKHELLKTIATSLTSGYLILRGIFKSTDDSQLRVRSFWGGVGLEYAMGFDFFFQFIYWQSVFHDNGCYQVMNDEMISRNDDDFEYRAIDTHEIGAGAAILQAVRALSVFKPDLAVAAMAVGLMPQESIPMTCIDSVYNCRPTHRSFIESEL